MGKDAGREYQMAVRTYLKAMLSIFIFLAAMGPAAASPPTQAQPEFPADGAVIAGNTMTYLGDYYIWTKLVFIPGATAVKHTGYFSDDYSKVENRAEDANLGLPPYRSIPGWEYTFFAGNPQIPPADESLVRGTKYYWTVDATDDLGNTFAGDIWEFTVLGWKAFEPSPPNEATFVERDVLLCWEPGYQVDLHDVYIGTSWQDVYNADIYADIYQGWTIEPNWSISGLPTDTKIYWRIDEVHDPMFFGPIYKGDVWCFTTIRREATVLDPADGEVIDGEPYPEPPAPQTHIWTILIFDKGPTAVKHTGYFSDNYSKVYNRHQDANLGPPPFPYAGLDNIYFAGNPEIEPATDTLVGGTTYYWTVDETDAQGNTFPGAVWEFTVRSYSYYATNPDPPNEATNIDTDVLLSWVPGIDAQLHDVYIGTSFDDVNDADPCVPFPADFLGTIPEPNIYVSGLAFNTKYYWRVDEFGGRPLPGTGPIYKGDVWCFTTRPAVGLFFVDIDAVGANNGSSWADAFYHLQDALSITRPGDEIHVAEGIYKPDMGAGITPGDRSTTFKLINGVTIEGGYAGYGEPDPDSRNIELYETILSGDIGFLGYNPDNSYHVVTGSGTDPTAELNGVIVTGGNGDNGGGMYNSHGSPTVINCTFSGNFSFTGGGMVNASGSSTLTNCIFSDNSASEGGGMFNGQSNITLINCTFSGNSAGIVGGGMYDSHSNSTVVNCTFSENSSRLDGGGMSGAFSEPTLTNCILWGNSSDYGSQIGMRYGSIVEVSYCNVQGGISGVYLYNSSIDWRDGNIDVDPCFIDVAGGDLRLSSDSPCIDTGDNNAPNLPATDMDGHPRIIDGDCNDTEVVDMGAYEFNYAYMGDFDYNCGVDFVDLSIFGLAWASQPGDFNWDFACNINIPADNVIDRLDLAAFADNWLAGF